MMKQRCWPGGLERARTLVTGKPVTTVLSVAPAERIVGDEEQEKRFQRRMWGPIKRRKLRRWISTPTARHRCPCRRRHRGPRLSAQ